MDSVQVAILADVGNVVPRLVISKLVADHLGAFALHEEAQPASRRTDLQHALVAPIDVTQVGALHAAEIPVPRHHAMPGDLDRMVRCSHRINSMFGIDYRTYVRYHAPRIAAVQEVSSHEEAWEPREAPAARTGLE